MVYVCSVYNDIKCLERILIQNFNPKKCPFWENSKPLKCLIEKNTVVKKKRKPKTYNSTQNNDQGFFSNDLKIAPKGKYYI